MSKIVSQIALDEAMAEAFMHTLRSSIECRLRSDIEPLVEAAVNEAISTFKVQAGQYVELFRDERLIKVIIERKP